MLTERINGVITRWDLPKGQRVPFKGEPFRVLVEDIDASGAEPIRTIKQIRVGHKMDTDKQEDGS